MTFPMQGVPRLHAMPPGEWERVHSADYPPLSFNPSEKSNARFSPFVDGQGLIVPALYAGSSIKAALMETVFHEIPVPSSGSLLVERNIAERKWARTRFSSKEALRLVDLTTVGLRRIGLARSEVIDTTSAKYPLTQGLARYLHEQFPDAHGIRWVSRLYDEGTCIVLYEDRIKRGMLVPSSATTDVLEGETLTQLLDLVDHLGMRYIPR